MHFKFDENSDPRWRQPLEHAGHRVSTVSEEGLHGADDSAIAQTCQSQTLCLLTADLHFAQTLQYPPEHTPG